MSNPIQHVVVLGGGYAGTLAAARLSHAAARGLVRLTFVSGSDALVERIRLHQRAVGQSFPTVPYNSLLREPRLTRLHAWATSIDPNARSLALKLPSGEQTSLSFDHLLLANGSGADVHQPAHTFSVSTLEASDTLATHLRSLASEQRVVVCGGGLTAIETATEIAEHFPSLHVTLVSRDRIGPGLSTRAQEALHRSLSRMNIHVLEHVAVQSVSPTHVTLSHGETLASECTIWCAGFSISSLARDAGLAVDPHGRTWVDTSFRSLSHPFIRAIGDCALISTEPSLAARMACATAMPMGAHAATQIVSSIQGKPETPFRWGAFGICVSLGRRDAIVQRAHADETPTDSFYSGRWGAWIKERVCRFTLWSIRMESRFEGFYRWRQPSPAQRVALLPATSSH